MTLSVIAMQGHQQKGRQNSTSSNNKDKSNTIIETSTAEDHDDENLHNPETVQDAVIHLEVDEATSSVVVVSHTFSALVANPKKTTLHGGQSRSWSAEQGKKEKEKVYMVFKRVPHWS